MKTKCITYSAVIGLLLFFMGCASSGPIDLNTPGEQRLSVADQVDVVLSSEDANRVEPVIPGKETASTGSVWKRAFVGKEGISPASIRIVSSELRQNLAGGGFVMRYTYTVEAVLTIGDRQVHLKGEGTRAASTAMLSAMRQAVELAVVQVASQARAELSGIK